jgi:hypothetical protein
MLTAYTETDPGGSRHIPKKSQQAFKILIIDAKYYMIKNQWEDRSSDKRETSYFKNAL